LRRSAHSIADALVLRLSSLGQTRDKVEALYSQGLVAKRDVEHVYGSLFITAVASFEALLEELFLGLLSGRLVGRATIRPRVSVSSDRVARNVVYGGRPYFDWLPYRNTTDRADIFFVGGRPFSILDDGDRSTIARMLCIRNALAHQSEFARRKFREEVIGSTPLLPPEKTPTGFLRSAFRVSPVQTRYEELTIELSTISRRLCH
jgi:hypothetical protein